MVLLSRSSSLASMRPHSFTPSPHFMLPSSLSRSFSTSFSSLPPQRILASSASSTLQSNPTHTLVASLAARSPSSFSSSPSSRFFHSSSSLSSAPPVSTPPRLRTVLRRLKHRIDPKAAVASSAPVKSIFSSPSDAPERLRRLDPSANASQSRLFALPPTPEQVAAAKAKKAAERAAEMAAIKRKAALKPVKSADVKYVSKTEVREKTTLRMKGVEDGREKMKERTEKWMSGAEEMVEQKGNEYVKQKLRKLKRVEAGGKSTVADAASPAASASKSSSVLDRQISAVSSAPLRDVPVLGFRFRRTASYQWPVFTKYRHHANRVSTIVRGYEGSQSSVAKQLRLLLGATVEMQMRAGSIEVKGNHSKLVKAWLSSIEA